MWIIECKEDPLPEMKGFAIEGRLMSNKHKPQLSQLPLDLSIYSTKNDILGFWPLLRLRQTIESLSVKWSNNRFERCFHITIHWRDASKFTATIGGNLFTHFSSPSSFFPETISTFHHFCSFVFVLLKTIILVREECSTR